jgi:hypothetical protein
MWNPVFPSWWAVAIDCEACPSVRTLWIANAWGQCNYVNLIVNNLCIGMPDGKVIIGMCRICLNFVGGGICQHCVFILPVCFACNNGTINCDNQTIASCVISVLRLSSETCAQGRYRKFCKTLYNILKYGNNCPMDNLNISGYEHFPLIRPIAGPFYGFSLHNGDEATLYTK